MTYLELVQRACRECALTGVPTTVVSQSGMYARMVNWIASALNDIETAHPDWDWMWLPFSFPTVDGQSEYSAVEAGIAADTHNEWNRYETRNYVTSVGNISEIFMDYIDYDIWRNAYLYGATRSTRSRPLQFSISPQQKIALGPVPAAGYTITGYYYRNAQILDPVVSSTNLTPDTLTPDMPVDFHIMIVYKAMMYYGGYMGAPEVYDRGELEFGKMMKRLDNKRLPDMEFA